MAEIFDGLNSTTWLRLGELPGGYKVEIAEIPPRDRFKYSYDLWSQGLAMDAYTIGRTWRVSMRNRAFGKGMWMMNFDTKGRLVNISFTGREWNGRSVGSSAQQNEFDTLHYPIDYRPEIHRLIGGSWLKGKWVDHIEDTNLSYRPDVIREDHPFYKAAMEALNGTVHALREAGEELIPESSRGVFRTFTSLDPLDEDGLLRYREEFHRMLDLSGEIPVEPPELSQVHYHAVPVLVEHGCGGTCTYCTLYGRKIQVLDEEKVFRQMDQMAELLGEELDHYRFVTLLEGDVFPVPADSLCRILEYARERFMLAAGEPFAHTFARAGSVCAKSDVQLKQLAEAGLKNVNIGLETGCPELLHAIKPGQHLEKVKEAVERLTAAGIGVSLNILAGAGGKKYEAAHRVETVDFIMGLPEEVQVYYSPLMISEDTPYGKQQSGFGTLSPEELERQCRFFQVNLNAARYLFVPV